MRSKDVVIGMKVTVHAKSVGTTWENFRVGGVPEFMIVKSTFQCRRYTLESPNLTNFRWGIFIAKDFEPYIEEGEELNVSN